MGPLIGRSFWEYVCSERWCGLMFDMRDGKRGAGGVLRTVFPWKIRYRGG